MCDLCTVMIAGSISSKQYIFYIALTLQMCTDSYAPNLDCNVHYGNHITNTRTQRCYVVMLKQIIVDLKGVR